MNKSNSEGKNLETLTKFKPQNYKSLRYIVRGIAICAIAVIAILFFVLYYWVSKSAATSQECVEFRQLLDDRLTRGLESLLQGKHETTVTVENKLKADMIVLCQSYSEISYSKLREAGISDRTAKMIDVTYLDAGAYYYLLKDNDILCNGHTRKADLRSNQIITKLNEKIAFTLILDPNAQSFKNIKPEAKTVPIESLNHVMIITDVK